MKHNINWSEEMIEFLKETYPHYGLELAIDKFGISRAALRSKTNCLKLEMLAKEKRLCLECKENFQCKRGFLCSKCSNEKRSQDRRVKEYSIKERLSEMLRSARRRSKISCDLTVDDLLNIYKIQEGKCFYSDIPMELPKWGTGRNPYSVSIDQKNAGQGYTKENIVLCCFVVNMGKSTLSYREYLNVCKKVLENKHL